MTAANDTGTPAERQATGIMGLLSFLAGASFALFTFLAMVNMIADVFGLAFFARGPWLPFLVFVAAFTLSRIWWTDSKASQDVQRIAMRAAAQEAAVIEVARQLDHNFAERVRLVIREANLRGWHTPPPTPDDPA